MNKKKMAGRLMLGGMLACLLLGMQSCGSDNGDIAGGNPDPNKGGGTEQPNSEFDSKNVNYDKGGYFLALRAPLTGTEYVMQVEEIEGKELDIRKNQMELPSVHYTWLFRGGKAIGMSYQQDQPGVGYMLQANGGNKFQQKGQFLVQNRFTNYDFYDENMFITSVGGQVSSDNKRNDGATFEFWDVTNGTKRKEVKTIWTQDITKTKEQITFSSIVKMNDGTFLTAIVRSSFRERGSDGGSSVGDVQYPDSMWIARMDVSLNVKKIYGSDKISYAAGQYRSQMFREVLKADDGTVFIFSNAFNAKTTKKAGALKFDTANDRIDPDYYFNIQEAAGGYKFRRVWYMTGHKFLLEIFNDYTVTSLGVGHQFAIVDMDAKKLTWVTGLPPKGSIISGSESGGVPMFHNGAIYMPITKQGEDASIYKIDINTAAAKKITVIKGAEEVRSIGYIR